MQSQSTAMQNNIAYSFKKYLMHTDGLMVLIFSFLCLVLWFIPTGFESHLQAGQSYKAQVLDVNNADIKNIGLVKTGDQGVRLEITDGPFKGDIIYTNNILLGQMDKDKIFKKGDDVLAVITLNDDGEIINVVPQDHYRLGLELFLMLMFAGLLILYGGFTGVKSLLSFVFTALVLWKVLIPLLLKGANPIGLTLLVIVLLTSVIIFLVAGFSKKGFTAFFGAILGVLASALLSIIFTDSFQIHGAIMPFSEILLYSGYAHLKLTDIYIAAIFLASSGAVMDIAMDIAASMEEILKNNATISRKELFFSGIRIGRAVVGTMTTTLLLAYSGGLITLFMGFMAQGIPFANTFNLIYVAAEVLKTLVGSFGLVLVAPFTSVVGAIIFTKKREFRI